MADDSTATAPRTRAVDAALLAGQAPVGLAGFGPDLVCTWANPRFGDLVSRRSTDVVGVTWEHLLPLTRAADLARVREVLEGDAGGADFVVVMRDRDADDGTPAPQEVWRLHAYPLTDHGDVVGLGLVAHDVTDDELELTDLRHRAETDGLTGLLNRTAFHDRLRVASPRTPSAESVMLLLVVDLDDFKGINDTYGHAVGDVVLAETGRRLSRVIGRRDPLEVAGRIGGDEFALLCHASRGRSVVDEVREALTRPVPVGPGLWVTPSVTIGVATLQATGPERSFAAADAAMYADKRRRRPSVHLEPAAAQDVGQDRDIDLTDPLLDRASALVMRRTGCDAPRALALLARHARSSGRTLVQVAGELDADLALVAWTQLDGLDALDGLDGADDDAGGPDEGVARVIPLVVRPDATEVRDGRPRGQDDRPR